MATPRVVLRPQPSVSAESLQGAQNVASWPRNTDQELHPHWGMVNTRPSFTHVALKLPSPDSAREAGGEHLHLSDSQAGLFLSVIKQGGKSIPPGAVYIAGAVCVSCTSNMSWALFWALGMQQ